MSGKTELRLFDVDLPQIAAVDAYFVPVFPDTALGKDLSDIVFTLNGSGSEYMDLNDTTLTVRARILDPDGNPYDKTATKNAFYPVNYFMNALFKDVKLLLNGKIIEGGSDYYSYKATIEDIFNFDLATKDIQLRTKGYYPNVDDRKVSIDQSEEKEYCGALRLDFFNQPKYLIPGVDVQLIFKRQESVFALEGDSSGTAKPCIDITSAFLRVRKVKVNAGVEMGHTLGLQTKNVKYFYPRGKAVRYNIGKGTWDYVKENIFPGGMCPKMLIITLLSQIDYNGENCKNSPFVFKHKNLKRLNVHVDGSSVPFRGGYEPNFATGMVEDEYFRSIIQCAQHLNKNVNNGITLEKFKDGTMTFFLFNLTPDFEVQQKQVFKDVNLRVDMAFDKPLDESINVFIYGVFDTEIEITKERSIITTNHVF